MNHHASERSVKAQVIENIVSPINSNESASFVNRISVVLRLFEVNNVPIGVDARAAGGSAGLHYDWDRHNISAARTEDALDFLDGTVRVQDVLKHVLG
jgi:hypothetical protein